MNGVYQFVFVISLAERGKKQKYIGQRHCNKEKYVVWGPPVLTSLEEGCYSRSLSDSTVGKPAHTALSEDSGTEPWQGHHEKH